MNRLENFAGVRVLLAALALAVAGPFASPGLLGIGREMDRQQGNAANDKTEYNSVLALLSEAILRDPTSAENYFNRGMTYSLQGDNDKAIADLTQAIELSPHEAVFYYSRGLAYVAKGDADKSVTEYDQAVADFNQAVQLDPQYAQAFYSRAYAYAAEGAYDKAIPDYVETTQLAPGKAEAFNNLAWLLATCPQAGVRDGKKAVGYATTACQLTAWKEAAALDTLAAAYAETGDFDDAVKWENQCLAASDIDSSIIADGKSRLALYQARRPYHEDK